jgi:hypothetical protein
MNKIFISLLLLVFLKDYGQNQNLLADPIDNNKLQADTYIGTDGMGAVYFVKNDIFYKQNNKQSWQYNNIKLGKITSIDIINPLKILVFYENFNALVILDNQLNEIQNINFSNIETPILTKLTGNASQNKIWLFNTITQKIGLYNPQNSNLKTLGQPILSEIIYYKSDFNQLHFIEKDNTWYTCDIFGKFTLQKKLPKWDQIFIIDTERILYSKGEKLYYQNNKTDTIFELEIVEKTFDNFHYKDQILSIFTNQEITNYKITLP